MGSIMHLVRGGPRLCRTLTTLTAAMTSHDGVAFLQENRRNPEVHNRLAPMTEDQAVMAKELSVLLASAEGPPREWGQQTATKKTSEDMEVDTGAGSRSAESTSAASGPSGDASTTSPEKEPSKSQAKRRRRQEAAAKNNPAQLESDFRA